MRKKILIAFICVCLLCISFGIYLQFNSTKDKPKEDNNMKEADNISVNNNPIYVGEEENRTIKTGP